MNTADSNTETLLSDRDLLEDFQLSCDAPSFRLIVERYSSLVMGICRRNTTDSHDAEDAFQATFLILAQRCAHIRHAESLPSWLYGVAFRTSRRITKKRYQKYSSTMDTDVSISDDPFENVNARFVKTKTDEAIQELPEKLRAPVVMRYVMGKSNAQVAEELKLSVAAVEGRLKRAKNRLRMRLTRFGISLSSAIVAFSVVSGEGAAAVSNLLVTATVESSLSLDPSLGSSATADVSQLVREEVFEMSVFHGTKLATVLAGCAIVRCFWGGVAFN